MDRPLPMASESQYPNTGRGPVRGAPAPLPALAAVLIFSLGLWGGQQAAPPASDPKPEAKAADTGPATYVGSEMCQACHEDVFKSFLKNPHHVVETNKSKGWEGKACESCHGPGSKHAESTSADDILNPAKAPVAKAEEACLKCHLNRPSQVGRIQGGHGRQQVSCSACHSVHSTPPSARNLIPTEGRAGLRGSKLLRPKSPQAVNEKCATCHQATMAQFNKPHTHRLNNGAMSCVDCHNPHGGFLPRLQQTFAANEPGCLKCHTDKRGPFTFEHAPMRLESCQSCHEPHGSANPKMLTRQEVHLQCLECHSNLPARAGQQTPALGGVPPAFHDLRSPRIRNCTLCHIKIHGSYANRAFLR